VVIYYLRLPDVLRVANGLRLPARVKQLANAFSVLPEHRLFLGDDVLLIVIEFDNGVWRLRIE